ncbi:hypothetical protein OG874_02880 [Nocardia sp. NBC_00565]|uniref:hypothetical protein n=1 Tax=Nocardia sp. NBC_00565 TaxID=2975993 RepID=UPI002E81FCA1|nr:hypothetical protein [Nocardia sp. NBC_00565]WUC04176.1 hypothetical protein OG874_02880 [Nocardia sp. NBC_00565]
MTIIRPAVQSDVAALSELARAAYVGYVERMGREPAPMQADYAALVETRTVWVAEQANLVVGLLVLEVRSGHLLLDNIAVSPNARSVRAISGGRRTPSSATALTTKVTASTHERFTARQRGSRSRRAHQICCSGGDSA